MDLDLFAPDLPRPGGGVDVVELARLVDHLADAVVLLDPRADLVWGNRAAQRLFGRDIATGEGTAALEFVHPEDIELVIAALGVVQDREVGRPLDIRVRSETGWRLVEVIGVAVDIPEPGSVLVTLRDVTDRRRWEIAANETALFRSLIHNAATVTMLVTRDGVVRAASSALTRLIGHHPQQIVDRELASFVVDEHRATIDGALEAAADTRRASIPVTADVSFVRRGDRPPVPVELTIVNLLDDPTVEGFVVSAHDVTDRVTAESELREALSLLEATLNSTADGVLVVDGENHIRSFNERFVEMWSLPVDVLASLDDQAAITYVLEQLVDPTAFVAKIEELYSRPDSESHDTLEFKDGRIIERDSRPQRVAGEIVGRVWTFHDITERKRLERQLAHRALHDSLTGLANQALFRDRVAHALGRTRRSGRDVAVLFMDLDNFKTVNDSLGHAAGDQLLVAVADRLRRSLRDEDTAARLGGDEFAVVIEDVVSDTDAIAVAERIMDVLKPPVLVNGNEVVPSISIGIALGDSRLDSQRLLRNADLAMYTAKGQGRGRHAVFEQGMHVAAMKRLELEADLRYAVARRQLAVLYQPIVDLHTGDVVGAEALVRWHHPRRGLLDPMSFIPLAEETGLICELGEHIMSTATTQVCGWNDAEHTRSLDVSVNLSPSQLLDQQLPGQIERVLRGSGLEPRQLIIEITEGAMVQDAEAAARNAIALHGLGVRLAVDDFGTGYSSLTHLQRFPIDIVKIDRSFVLGVDGSAEEAALAKAIVRLAQTLGLTVIAEGVETPAQAAHLHAIGCRLAQGFYFAEPLTADELRAFVANRST